MSLRNKTLTGIFWATTQQVSGQLIGLIVSAILARLLSPADFGLMGMIYIFITISATLSDPGMNQSLIRMVRPGTEDYSAVFYVNVFFSLLIYGILFLSAPLIADFYGKDILTWIIRVYSLVFVFSAFSSVQNTILVKKLDFKKQLWLSLPSLLLSGALGITLAATGYGVWSLVWSGVAKTGLNALQLWLYSDWRPAWIFDRAKFRYHFNFGIKFSTSELLNNVSTSIYPFVIGKFFTPIQTGYFTQTETVKQFPLSTILSPIRKVANPVLSNLQSDKNRLRIAYAKMERITMAALIPAMIFGIVLAEPLLRLLFSERWVAATPYLQIACLAGIISIAGTYNMLILNTQGKSGRALRVNIFQKVFMLAALAGAVPMGIGAVLWSRVIAAVVTYISGSIVACRTIGYRFWKLTADSLILLTLGTAMGAGVWGLKLAMPGAGSLLQLAVCISGGIILYAGLIFVFDRSVINDIRELFAGSFIGLGGRTGRPVTENDIPEIK